MTSDDRGLLVPYQITWRSGHVETIEAHQVMWPSAMGSMFGEPESDPRVFFHGEIDGHWRLLLVADAADILTIRALTGSEGLA